MLTKNEIFRGRASQVPWRRRSLSPGMLAVLLRSSGTRHVLARRSCSTNANAQTPMQRFWEWTNQKRPSWKENKTEAAVAFVVFGITGSTSVKLVRPTLKSAIGMEGSLRDGPWSYRLTSLVAVSPIYATLLVTFGTIAGRHRFFATMANKIFARFVPICVVSCSTYWCGSYVFPSMRDEVVEARKDGS